MFKYLFFVFIFQIEKSIFNARLGCLKIKIFVKRIFKWSGCIVFQS